MDYWLPVWWDAVEDWSDCAACLRQFGTPCVSCEVPPGLLALGCLVGGGTATIAGNCRGNQTVATAEQAQAAGRLPGADERLQFNSATVQVNDRVIDAQVTDVSIDVQNNLRSRNANRRGGR